MACFLVPTTEAIVTTIVEKKLKFLPLLKRQL